MSAYEQELQQQERQMWRDEIKSMTKKELAEINAGNSFKLVAPVDDPPTLTSATVEEIAREAYDELSPYIEVDTFPHVATAVKIIASAITAAIAPLLEVSDGWKKVANFQTERADKLQAELDEFRRTEPKKRQELKWLNDIITEAHEALGTKPEEIWGQLAEPIKQLQATLDFRTGSLSASRGLVKKAEELIRDLQSRLATAEADNRQLHEYLSHIDETENFDEWNKTND